MPNITHLYVNVVVIANRDRYHNVIFISDRVVQIHVECHIITDIVRMGVLMCNLGLSWIDSMSICCSSCSNSAGFSIIITGAAALQTVVVAVGGSARHLTLIAAGLLTTTVVEIFTTVWYAAIHGTTVIASTDSVAAVGIPDL